MRAKQRNDRIDGVDYRVRLECDNHVILHSQFGRHVGTGRMRNVFLAVDLQPQAACAHRGEVRSASNQADIDMCARHFDANQASDGARPEHAHLQASLRAARLGAGNLPCSWYTTHQESTSDVALCGTI